MKKLLTGSQGMGPATFTRLFYIFQFFFDFIFIYAVEKLLFLSRGLNLTQIVILLFLWSIMAALFEVPSGAIADRWSRRKMLILSGLFFALCYFVWIFSNSFSLFLVGFFLRTLGGTFASGTLQAYVYDFLKHHQAEDEFEQIWGRGDALRLLGIGVAMALGGFLSEISYALTLALSSLSILTVSVVALFWPEVSPAKSTGEVKYWQFVRQATQYALTHPIIFRAIMFLVFVPATLGMLEEFNDVYLNFLGYPRFAIGLIFATASGFQALGSLVAHKFKENSWRAMEVCVFLTSITLFSMFLVKSSLMAFALILLATIYGLTNVLTQGVIQRETESYHRAAVTSATGVFENLLPGGLIFGFLANRYSLQTGYGFFGVFVLFYFALRYLLKLR